MFVGVVDEVGDDSNCAFVQIVVLFAKYDFVLRGSFPVMFRIVVSWKVGGLSYEPVQYLLKSPVL